MHYFRPHSTVCLPVYIQFPFVFLFCILFCVFVLYLFCVFVCVSHFPSSTSQSVCRDTYDFHEYTRSTNNKHTFLKANKSQNKFKNSKEIVRTRWNVWGTVSKRNVEMHKLWYAVLAQNCTETRHLHLKVRVLVMEILLCMSNGHENNTKRKPNFLPQKAKFYTLSDMYIVHCAICYQRGHHSFQ